MVLMGLNFNMSVTYSMIPAIVMKNLHLESCSPLSGVPSMISVDLIVSAPLC